MFSKRPCCQGDKLVDERSKAVSSLALCVTCCQTTGRECLSVGAPSRCSDRLMTSPLNIPRHHFQRVSS